MNSSDVVSQDTVTLLDINNSVPKDMYKNDIEGKYNYTQKDTFMGFHCGNTASSKLSFCEMKYQKIMARTLPEEVTQGTLEGDIVPGDITFYRHVLVEKGFPHHGAVAFGHFGKELFEVFKYIGVPVDEIGYNQPAGVRYPTENPFA